MLLISLFSARWDSMLGMVTSMRLLHFNTRMKQQELIFCGGFHILCKMPLCKTNVLSLCEAKAAQRANSGRLAHFNRKLPRTHCSEHAEASIISGLQEVLTLLHSCCHQYFSFNTNYSVRRVFLKLKLVYLISKI